MIKREINKREESRFLIIVAFCYSALIQNATNIIFTDINKLAAINRLLF
jgi:hypothetical protein